MFKLDFAKKFMAREKPEDKIGVRYNRAARTGLAVEHFYDKNAIHYPGQKTPQSKVLTEVPHRSLYKHTRRPKYP